MRSLLRGSALLACSLAVPAFAQISIGAGSAVQFGDATINFGCSDLSIAGQAGAAAGSLTGLRNFSVAPGGGFSAGNGQITLGGNFVNGGAFNAGGGAVGIVDACGSGTSQLSGATNFFRFAASTSTGKQLQLPANTTQSVAGALSLTGSAGNLLQVQSTAPGQRANLAVATGAAQTIAYVAARDNAATAASIAPGSPASYSSVDGGNLINWFLAVSQGGPIPAPGLGLLGRLLLLGGLVGTAWQAARKRRPRGV
ncbi:MAG: hypothetical protein J0I77_03735 [Rudaea sp.]|uniref:hypothetical protein n=1 Tax=unclassified Rudaea TaxID=2627037 RepID=UPI0010F8481C|nr:MULTISPECIES: hypothetical protein [unclassified Rudaea]MBN8884806.1 hypothetical protein [Rudaea sp.]MBR0345494.1 hypothetical protein [Rudaea sp.]